MRVELTRPKSEVFETSASAIPPLGPIASRAMHRKTRAQCVLHIIAYLARPCDRIFRNFSQSCSPRYNTSTSSARAPSRTVSTPALPTGEENPRRRHRHGTNRPPPLSTSPHQCWAPRIPQLQPHPKTGVSATPRQRGRSGQPSRRRERRPNRADRPSRTCAPTSISEGTARFCTDRPHASRSVRVRGRKNRAQRDRAEKTRSEPTRQCRGIPIHRRTRYACPFLQSVVGAQTTARSSKHNARSIAIDHERALVPQDRRHSDIDSGNREVRRPRGILHRADITCQIRRHREARPARQVVP